MRARARALAIVAQPGEFPRRRAFCYSRQMESRPSPGADVSTVALSIVIVNYRTWDHLELALNGLVEDLPVSWEIVVVDNCSGDGRLDSFAQRFPQARFVASPINGGFAQGCNTGVLHSHGELLLFMNPDVIASVVAVQTLLNEKRDHPEVSILSARQVDPRGRRQKAFDEFPTPLTHFKIFKVLARFVTPGGHPDPYANQKSLVACDWVSGSFLLVSRNDLARFGGWSEDYWMYSEDVDLCRCARECGGIVAFTPSVEVVHAHGAASRLDNDVAARTRLETFISKHIFFERHLSGISLFAGQSLLAIRSLATLATVSMVSLLALRRSANLNRSARVLRLLVAHYVGVLRSGEWRSPRSPARENGLALGASRGAQAPTATSAD
ncbi:MAG: GT2 family glycosyltransferase [Hyphomicrobiaceae bacterium]|jgi:GT2 family glycosyltransferase